MRDKTKKVLLSESIKSTSQGLGKFKRVKILNDDKYVWFLFLVLIVVMLALFF